MFFLFFFKQKTAYEMRISDWSSDVCSSDLEHRGRLPDFFAWRRGLPPPKHPPKSPPKTSSKRESLWSICLNICRYCCSSAWRWCYQAPSCFCRCWYPVLPAPTNPIPPRLPSMNAVSPQLNIHEASLTFVSPCSPFFLSCLSWTQPNRN